MESGLVVVAGEAEEHLRGVRSRFDPYAGIGVPPHVTVLYPFYDPLELNDEIAERITQALQGTDAFEFRLSEVSAFEGAAVYLVPTPAEPFVALTEKLWNAFPDRPPFAGEYDTVIPHLTVGWVDDGATVDGIAAVVGGDLPIPCSAKEVTLLVERQDGWVADRRFPLEDGGQRRD